MDILKLEPGANIPSGKNIVIEQIIEYCATELVKPIDAHTPLVETLDSIDILELISYLEFHHQIEIDPNDILPENFGTAHKIAVFLGEEHDLTSWSAYN